MKSMKRILAFTLMLIMVVALTGVTQAYAITEKKDRTHISGPPNFHACSKVISFIY